MEKEAISKIVDNLNPNQKLVLLLAREILNDIHNETNGNDINLVIDVWWEFVPNLGNIYEFEILDEMAKKEIKILNDFESEIKV